jgi:hypothetical protein
MNMARSANGYPVRVALKGKMGEGLTRFNPNLIMALP